MKDIVGLVVFCSLIIGSIQSIPLMSPNPRKVDTRVVDAITGGFLGTAMVVAIYNASYINAHVYHFEDDVLGSYSAVIIFCLCFLVPPALLMYVALRLSLAWVRRNEAVSPAPAATS